MDIQSTMSLSMLLGNMEAYVVPNKLPYLPNVMSNDIHLRIVAGVRDTPVLYLLAPMSTRDLKHIPSHYRRANERGVALTSGIDEVAVNEVVVIELCDSVWGDERQGTIRVLELPDQAFWKSSKE